MQAVAQSQVPRRVNRREVAKRQIQLAGLRFQALAALASRMHLSYKAAGITFEEDLRFERVLWNNQTVALMEGAYTKVALCEHLRDHLSGYAHIAADEIDFVLRRTLKVPARHHYLFDITAAVEAVLTRAEPSLTIRVEKVVKSGGAPVGLSATVTIRLDECSASLNVAHAAFPKGPAKDLIPDRLKRVDAESYADLGIKIATLFNAVSGCAASPD